MKDWFRESLQELLVIAGLVLFISSLSDHASWGAGLIFFILAWILFFTGMNVLIEHRINAAKREILDEVNKARE
jgi:hypothetical protein